MTRLRLVACRILTMHDPEPVELVLSAVAVANAAGLAALRPFGLSSAYEAMARVAPEAFWAAVLGGLGAAHLGAVAADVRGRPRKAAALGNALGLMFLDAAFAAPGPGRWTTGVPIFAVLAGAAIWCAVRVGQRED